MGFILTTPFIGPHENITIRGFHSDKRTYHTIGNISICGFHSYDHTYRTIWKYIDSSVLFLDHTYRTIWVDIDWPLSFLRPLLSDDTGLCQVVVFILTATLIGPYRNISIRVFVSYDKSSKYRISLVWLKNSFTHCSISGDDWPHRKLTPLQLIIGHCDSESYEMRFESQTFLCEFYLFI